MCFYLLKPIPSLIWVTKSQLLHGQIEGSLPFLPPYVHKYMHAYICDFTFSNQFLASSGSRSLSFCMAKSRALSPSSLHFALANADASIILFPFAFTSLSSCRLGNVDISTRLFAVGVKFTSPSLGPPCTRGACAARKEARRAASLSSASTCSSS
jgi:hypothetical protein